MPAMTMSYKVRDPAVAQELKPGEMIAADLITKNNRFDNIEALALMYHALSHDRRFFVVLSRHVFPMNPG